MSWKISVSLERDAEALLVVQRMIYAAVKAQGATDLEAHSAARSLREALALTNTERHEAEPAETNGSPVQIDFVQIDLEYDEETITLLSAASISRKDFPRPGSGTDSQPTRVRLPALH